MKTTAQIDLVKFFGKSDIDLLKLLAKNPRVKRREYTDKDGKQVALEIELDVFPKKRDKERVISSGPGWTLISNHWVAISQTKEQRNTKEDAIFVGEGKQFINNNETTYESTVDGKNVISNEDVPF